MLVNLYGFSGEKIHNTEEPKWELGATAIVRDHVFRYVKASAAITANSVVVATNQTEVANITTFENTGDRASGRYPWIDDSGESMTVNYWKDFYLFISNGTGVGLMKRVHDNTATKIRYMAVFPELGETDPFSTAPDITTDYTLISPWYVENSEASDKIQTGIGYAYAAITQHYYGWVITSGVGNPKSGGTGVIDTVYGCGDNTAGQGTMAGTDDDVGDFTPMGVTLIAGGDDERWPVLFRGIGL